MAVLKYSVVPRHDIVSDGVAVSFGDEKRGSLGKPPTGFLVPLGYEQALLLQTWYVVVREASGVVKERSKRH